MHGRRSTLELVKFLLPMSHKIQDMNDIKIHEALNPH